MLYLEETLNLEPASPETLDRFVELAGEVFVPVCERLGCRMVIAWYSDREWFCQVQHVLEFDDLERLKDFRRKASHDEQWGEYAARLEEIAPVRRSRLLEAVGAVPLEVLHRAAAESRESPLGAYSLAILEVAPQQMTDFLAGLEQGAANLPIIASWRPVSGSPNEIIDVWRGALRLNGYQPADDGSMQFFRNLRPRAPKERLVPVFALPYSYLR